MFEHRDKIADYNEALASAGAKEVLLWAAETFPGRVSLASSLGIEDQILTAVIAENHIAIPVFTLDTGRLFPETYELIARTSERYVPVRVYFPDATEIEEMVAALGIDLFRDSVAARKRCCEVRKVRPLRRAQADLDAWVCGLRSGQGATRERVDMVEWDETAGLVKINPLASWSEDDVWAYAREHNVVYNPLHDSGFPSIGCAPCTRAIEPGEDVRSGRWWWESAEHRECGLHTHRGRLGGATTEAPTADVASSPTDTGASR